MRSFYLNLKIMLSSSDIKKVFIVIISQVLIGLLDLIGVAIFGVLGALTVTGIQSKVPGDRVSVVLKLLKIYNFEFKSQILILALLATSFMLCRTLLSIFFIKRTLFFLSRRAALKSKEMVSKFFSLKSTEIRNFGTQKTIYALTTGVWTFMLDVIGAITLIISDLSVLIILSFGLFVVDPGIALSSLLVFSGIAGALYLLSHSKAQQIGEKKSEIEIETNVRIVNLIETYREATVRNRKSYFVDNISKIRFNLASVEAESSFLPYIGKYVIESSVVVGILLIAGFQFLRKDAVNAFATLTVFMAAASRIAPAVLRIQQGFLLVRSRTAQSIVTVDLARRLIDTREITDSSDVLDLNHNLFQNEICVKNLSVSYIESTKPVLQNINLDIKKGEFIAIVGTSGAGKTSLVDAILGVIPISDGEVLVSGKPIEECISTWPGAIGYVPQEVAIFEGSIRENISFGFNRESYSDDHIESVLLKSELGIFVKALENGLETRVGERGTKLSGGQRQRIGIARALFTNPRILFLDEATSSLDSDTEFSITNSISELKGKTTLIVIAHRLSSVRLADRVIYLQEGKIRAEGTFDQVRKQVPDFERQASLMGL
jgi:ABC-type multidrug transport system fused ATPase/permease subunit